MPLGPASSGAGRYFSGLSAEAAGNFGGGMHAWTAPAEGLTRRTPPRANGLWSFPRLVACRALAFGVCGLGDTPSAHVEV